MPVKANQEKTFYLLSTELAKTDGESWMNDSVLPVPLDFCFESEKAQEIFDEMTIDEFQAGFVYECRLVKKITKSGYKVENI